MNLDRYQKLDNPVWNALNETHQGFSINYDSLKFYDPICCPFGGCVTTGDQSAAIEAYASYSKSFFIVGDKPIIPKSLLLKNELVCLQMTLDGNTGIEILEPIVQLNHRHEEALFHLVNLVQPGYFRKNTSRLGDYYGVFINGDLVAATGERMKMNDFTEVSAIVTHPEHTGKGYAKQLITHVVNRILTQKKIPYLHVAQTNAGAISLYLKLGFEIRRKISFWNLISTDNKVATDTTDNLS